MELEQQLQGLPRNEATDKRSTCRTKRKHNTPPESNRAHYGEELGRGQVLAPKGVGVVASTSLQRTRNYKVGWLPQERHKRNTGCVYKGAASALFGLDWMNTNGNSCRWFCALR